MCVCARSRVCVRACVLVCLRARAPCTCDFVLTFMSELSFICCSGLVFVLFCFAEISMLYLLPSAIVLFMIQQISSLKSLQSQCSCQNWWHIMLCLCITILYIVHKGLFTQYLLAQLTGWISKSANKHNSSWMTRSLHKQPELISKYRPRCTCHH